MVISAIGRIAAKAAAAGLKKARTAEGTKGSSKLFKNYKMTAGMLPAAAREPGKIRASVNSAVSEKINSFSEKQLKGLSKTNFGPLLNQKVKRKVQDALDRFKKPSRQKGGGMATRGMGAALRGGGMALRGMGAVLKKEKK
jgi:hypothetical protein